MPFPNHPDKHRAEAVVTPEQSAEYARPEATNPPEAVVLCYSRGLMEYLIDRYDGRTVEEYYGDLYVFEDTALGVVGNFGIGAPVTAMVMEDLIADGVETFLSVGFAGSLSEDVGMGEVVVAEEAIRDEGTSHHYLDSERDVRASESLVATARETLRERDEQFHVAPTWTTDAIYRETEPEIERYAAEGVLTVEMEAAATFAVAAHRGVEAGAMFVASDYLGTGEWEPRFREAEEHLHRLGDTARATLATHLQ